MDNIKDGVTGVFNSVSQMNFLQKPWFGFIIFVGVLFLNVYAGVAVLIGSILSYLIARVIYDKEFAISGLPTFNTVLLILLLYVFLGGFTSLLYVIPTALISMLYFYILNFLLKKVDLVTFALPAVFGTYTMILIDKALPGVFFTDKYALNIARVFDGLDFKIANHFVTTIGDIYLQASIVFSLLLLISYLIFEKEYVLYVLASYFFSLIIFYVSGFFFEIVLMSFTTFNILLTMMAMKAFGLLPINKWLIVKLFSITLAVILLKFLLDYLLGLVGLPSIVLPSIIVCDIILTYNNMKKQTDPLSEEQIA